MVNSYRFGRFGRADVGTGGFASDCGGLGVRRFLVAFVGTPRPAISLGNHQRRGAHRRLRRLEFPQLGLAHGLCGTGRLPPRREPIQHHGTLGPPVSRKPVPFGHLQRRLDCKPGAGLHRAIHLLVLRPQLRRPICGREIHSGLFDDGHECQQLHPPSRIFAG